MSWFFNINNINSDSYMSQFSSAILFVERVFIFEKEEVGFENTPEEVIKKINASPLHDEKILLMCK